MTGSIVFGEPDHSNAPPERGGDGGLSVERFAPAGKDANRRPIFKAERTKITVQDVIAAEGQRLPDVDHSQREFNTGMVMVVEHGKTPSPELIERTNGIRERWMDYWTTVTGHRSVMAAEP